MRIIFLGAPGSGKGTQSPMVEKMCHIPHISTGDMFREAVKNNTEYGKKAKHYMDEGLLVPDDVTIGIVEERLKNDDCKDGFLFDGFPRTIKQAEVLDELLAKLNISLDHVIYLKVDEDKLVSRISKRRCCPNCGASYHLETKPSKVDGICDECGSALIQRKDDTEEMLKVRLDTYNSLTAPLIDYYEKQGKLRTIDAMADISKVSNDIKEAINK